MTFAEHVDGFMLRYGNYCALAWAALSAGAGAWWVLAERRYVRRYRAIAGRDRPLLPGEPQYIAEGLNSVRKQWALQKELSDFVGESQGDASLEAERRELRRPTVVWVSIFLTPFIVLSVLMTLSWLSRLFGF